MRIASEIHNVLENVKQSGKLQKYFSGKFIWSYQSFSMIVDIIVRTADVNSQVFKYTA
jgi:hypothetical protein